MDVEKRLERTGSKRQWKYHYTYFEIPSCWDCGLPYESHDWIECILPHHTWELINPSYDVGCGLLCIGCIVRRLEFLGLEDVPVKIYNRTIRVETKEKDNDGNV